MTKFRVYFEPIDIEAESTEEVQQIYRFARLQPDIIRCVIAENNVWDHSNDKKIKVE